MKLRIIGLAEAERKAMKAKQTEVMTDLALMLHMFRSHRVDFKQTKHGGLTYLFCDDVYGRKGYCFSEEGKLLRSNRTVPDGHESDSNMSAMPATKHPGKPVRISNLRSVP